MKQKLKHLLAITSMVMLAFLFTICGSETAYAADNGEVLFLPTGKQRSSTEDDVTTGEGWKYVKSKETLYLNNANIKHVIGSSENLKIYLSGENTVCGIDVRKGADVKKAGLTVYGPGTLNIEYSGKGGKTFDDTLIHVESGNITFKDCTVNLNVSFKKKDIAIIGCTDKITFDNCILNSNTKSTSKKYFNDNTICCGAINIKNSSLTLKGALGGIRIDSAKKSYITNSTVKIDTSKSNTENGAYGLEIIDAKLYIKNSTIDIKATYIPFSCDYSTVSVKDSSMKLKNTKNVINYALSIGSSKFTCSGKSKITITGYEGGIAAYQSQITLKGGSITSTSKKGSALSLAGYKDIDGSKLIIKGGTLKLSGKPYGLRFTPASSISFQKGSLTLIGKTAATNDVTKLSAIKKKDTAKAGSKKEKAKKVSKFKKSYKYIYHKKK